MSVVAFNPCITCGACCAFYRASFYWTEAAPELGGTVPPELTEKLNEHMAYMKGSWRDKPRCIALQGAIGEQVACAIYPQRASVCRDFPFAWDGGLANERCDKARAAWGLPPLENPHPAQPDFQRTPQVA